MTRRRGLGSGMQRPRLVRRVELIKGIGIVLRRSKYFVGIATIRRILASSGKLIRRNILVPSIAIKSVLKYLITKVPSNFIASTVNPSNAPNASQIQLTV